MNRFLKYWRRTGCGQAFRAHVIAYADDFVILSRGYAAEGLAFSDIRKIPRYFYGGREWRRPLRNRTPSLHGSRFNGSLRTNTSSSAGRFVSKRRAIWI
jgi:hypothetical protein